MRTITLILIVVGSALILSYVAFLILLILVVKPCEGEICVPESGYEVLSQVVYVLPMGITLLLVGLVIRYIDRKRARPTDK